MLRARLLIRIRIRNFVPNFFLKLEETKLRILIQTNDWKQNFKLNSTKKFGLMLPLSLLI